jgi:hypothetical protein
MAEEKKGGTNIYYYVIGAIVFGVGLGFVLNMRSKNKLLAANPEQAKAQAELDRIMSQDIGASKKAEAPDIVQNKVSTGEFRNDGFTGSKEDVAAPIVIKVEKPAEQQQQPSTAHHDTGVKIPANAIKATSGNLDAFADGDVIYSLVDSESKLARLVSGNYTFNDKDGNNMGIMKAVPRQKLGTITKVDMTGVYFKVAPDFKKYAFVGYDKIYKLG